MMYRIVHTTKYEYADAADECRNVLHLRPRDLPWQTCRSTDLRIEPAPERVHAYRDYFGNHVNSFAVYQSHRELTITAHSFVTSAAHQAAPLGGTPAWEEVRDVLQFDRSPETVAAIEHRFDSRYVATSPELREFAAECFPADCPIGEAALALTRQIHCDFRYDPAATTIDTSVTEVLERRRGVCQDFAHLMIACVRSLGLACRYVSGYLRTDPQPGRPRLVGADASHAWVSVYCPGFGWLDFDPTNGCRPSDRHITIGWGRDYHDLSPVKGVVLGGGQSALKVAVDVVPVDATGIPAEPIVS